MVNTGAFVWSGGHDEAVKRCDDTWTGVSSGSKCCTRNTVPFNASTYTITLITQRCSDNVTMTLPTITIQQGTPSTYYAVKAEWNDGSNQQEETISNHEFRYTDENGKNSRDREVTLTYSNVVISSAGSYQISIYFPNGDKDKYLMKTLTITPNCTQHSVTVAADDNNKGTVAGGGSYCENSEVTVTATPNPGYNFVNWTDNNSNAVVSTNASYTFTLTANVSYRANFAACTTRTVTLTAGANGSVSGGGEQCEGSVTVTATPNSGYRFVNWTNTSTSEVVSTDAEYTFNLSADISLTANFEEDPCTNTKTVQCVSGYVPVTIHDHADPYVEDKHDAYVATQEYASAYYYPLSLSTTISSFTLSIRMANSQHNYAWFNLYKKTANNSGDVEYDGAYYNKVGRQHMVSSNSWNSGEFNDAITSFADGNEGVGSSIPAGDYLLALSAKNNARFYYFTLTASENVFCESTCPEQDQHTITFEGNDNTGGSMSNMTICSGDNRTLPANGFTKTGYDFTGWKTNVAISTSAGDIAADGIVPNEATIQDITQDITLTAQWTPNPHTLTWVLDGGTVTTAGTQAAVDATGSPSGTVNYGETVTAPTVTKTGYNFSAWSPEVVSPMPDEDKTYTATWTAKTTTITIDDNDENHGSTTPETVTATWGSELPSFTAASGESGWSLKGYYTAETDGTKIINADGSLVANTDYATNDETPVWKYEGASVTLYPQYDLIICQSSRTYQVEDIMITTAGAVTNHDTQATPSNVKIITSDNQNYDDNTDDYFASISDGAFVYNTQEESAVYMEVDVPSAGNYTLDVYSGKGQGKNVWVKVYTTTGSGDDISYGGKTYYKQYNTQLNKDYSEYKIKLSDKDGTGVDDKEYPEGKCIIGIYTGNANCALDKIVLTRVDEDDVFCKHMITVNSTSGASSSASADKSMALSGETVTVTAPAASSGYSFTGWTASPSVTFADATALSTTFVMPDEDVTLTANYASDEFTISSLPWEGSQDLTRQTVVSAEAFSCFDTEITFTFSGEGTVQYYANNDREISLGFVTSGTAIELNDNLRAHGIYIMCTTGSATLTAVSKTTIGSVYEIWSAEGSTFGAVEVGDWSQQVVLGPEHFQTAKVGDVLRVYTSDEAGDAQGALQYIKTEGNNHTYLGLDNSTNEGLRDFGLSSDDKTRNYFERTIESTHLANLKLHGVIVKGRYYTIQSVELRASCSNQTMRTSAPDVTIYGDDESIDIMTNKLEFAGDGFTLGDWEHKLELDEMCFRNVTVGSIINFYMKVQDGATLSFRCNVDSVHAESYQADPPRCPSYGDISFDRTIHNLDGDEPQLIGRIEGYKVLYLLVDADMLTRLKETGMILCGKGTLIKVVEGVPETVVVNSNEERHVPTVVNNLTIYQGGEVTNNEDIEVLGKITYIRPAHDNGTDGKLGNKLDTWYTFALPFEVSDVEVYDETDKAWFDINAVYYSNDDTNQDANNPDGPGHYYLQYLSKQDIATDREAFITRWQYITPGHSLECVSQYENNNGTRYGYPKKDEAYIILFDSKRPIDSYFQTNTQVRYVGGPQTISGRDSLRTVVSDGYEYWMYANNTLHSFTLDDAYILNEEGTYFILQSNPTIRPFECYVQATEELKTRYAALPMRGFNIEDNTPTGAESIQGSAIRAEKILRNGQLIIIRNGVEYDATGVVIR